MKKAKSVLDDFLKWFYLYLGIIGLVSFSLFIMEEAIQSCQFANFSCSDTYRYDLIKKNIERISKINKHLKVLTVTLMWMQPFQWWAYQDYGDATDNYVASLQAEVLANDPGLYVGQEIDIDFYWKSVIKREKYILSAGKLVYRTETMPESNSVRIKGIVRKYKKKYEIKD